MSEEREMRRLVEQTNRSADRMSESELRSTRRTSEERVKQSVEELNRRLTPANVPDNLISDGSEE